ncbi:MAG TPA: hypothetical protein DCL73_09420, partial [Treponema sp.]|nr:hypothetical protein [Treponema sp.]
MKTFLYHIGIKISAILILFAVIFTVDSCRMDSDSGSTTDSGTTTTTTSQNTSSRDITSNTDDVVSNAAFANTIYLNLSTPSYSTDNSNFTAIPGTASAVTDNITIKVKSGYITIDASGSAGATVFAMTGTLSTGTVAIKSN